MKRPNSSGGREYNISLKKLVNRTKIPCFLYFYVNFNFLFIIYVYRDQRKLIAQKLFIQADKDGSKTLTFEETKKILQQLHIEITKDYLKTLFLKYDKDKNNAIDLKEFQDIISDITQKREILDIFKEFSAEASSNIPRNNNYDRDKQMMTDEELINFFKVCQKDQTNIEEIRSLILCLREVSSQKSLNQLMNDHSTIARETKNKVKISISEFTSLLFTANNSIFNPAKQEL